MSSVNKKNYKNGEHMATIPGFSRGCQVKFLAYFLPELFIMTTSIAQRLLDLNITLPKAASPAAAYVMYVRTGHQLYVSGHIAKKRDSPGWASWVRT